MVGLEFTRENNKKKKIFNTALCLIAHSSRHIQAVRSILAKIALTILEDTIPICVHIVHPLTFAPFPDSIWLNVFSLPRANENPITLPNLLAEKQTKKSFTRA